MRDVKYQENIEITNLDILAKMLIFRTKFAQYENKLELIVSLIFFFKYFCINNLAILTFVKFYKITAVNLSLFFLLISTCVNISTT